MAAKKKSKAKAKGQKPVAKKPAAKRAVAKSAASKRPAAKKAAPKGPAHQVVHWEIQSKNPNRLHGFYRDAFAWKVDTNNPMNYGMVASGGQHGIDGGIGGTELEQSRVLVYVGVPDIDEVLARVQSLGGRTVMPRTDLGMVTMALFQDPEGNTLGLVEG